MNGWPEPYIIYKYSQVYIHDIFGSEITKHTVIYTVPANPMYGL